MKGYAICTEPRSGSTFLSTLLSSTQALGIPTEYFNPESVRLTFGLTNYPQDPEQQLQLIPRLGATANGVYALKVFSRELELIAPTRWLERLPSLSLIFLERLDLLGQAISHVRAMQTRQWVSTLNAQAEPVYDPQSIAGELARLAIANARWRHYFARNGLPFLHLFYEQVLRSPQGTLEAVASWIGVSPTPQLDPAWKSQIDIQRDALTEDWRARFIAQSRSLYDFGRT